LQLKKDLLQNENIEKIKKEAIEIESNVKEISEYIKTHEKNGKEKEVFINDYIILLNNYEIFEKIQKLEIQNDEFNEIVCYLSLKCLFFDTEYLMELNNRIVDIHESENLKECEKNVEFEKIKKIILEYQFNSKIFEKKKIVEIDYHDEEEYEFVEFNNFKNKKNDKIVDDFVFL
jgi:hypothetical protein